MKYAPGLMVGQLSGKAGSTVASRNRNGSYFRTRVIPMLVRNQATEAVRAAFTENSQNWRGLTDTQRQGWTALGAGIQRSNSLGVPYNLTGLQAFQSVNRNLRTLGLTPVDDAPQQVAPDAPNAVFLTLYGVGVADLTTVTTGAASATQVVGDTSKMVVGEPLKFALSGELRTVSSITDATHVVLDSTVTTTTAEGIIPTPTGWFQVHFDPTAVPADTYYMIRATPPMSAGINRPTKNAYKDIVAMPPTETNPQDETDAYNFINGAPAAGNKVFVQIVAYSTSGFKSTPVGSFETAKDPYA